MRNIAQSGQSGWKSLVSARGFSLVELMIALVIGMVISLGAFQVFFSGKQSFNQVSSLGKRQESLRFLVDSLSYDVRSATSFSMDADNDELEIFHVGRPDNSVCSGSSNYSVTYYQDQGSIYVEPSCASADAIVIGIGDISFSYIPGGYGVIVSVTLVDDDGRLDDEVVEFRVANRSRVSEVIEFGGGS
ncbi:prepilin-type N-terminal cleavage/methylation domain-containing protein [Halomonas organivorans]